MVTFTRSSLNHGERRNCLGNLVLCDLLETNKTRDISVLNPMDLLTLSQANPLPCSACYEKHDK